MAAAEHAIAQTDDLSEAVGRSPSGQIIVPVNQTLTPAGLQVELPEMRPQAASLSPDGWLLAVSGKTHDLVLVDPVSGSIVQRVPLPPEPGTNGQTAAVSTHILEPDKEGQLSFTGLIFSPDGSRIFLSNVNGSVKVFSVDKEHRVAGLRSLSLPETGIKGRPKEIPASLALSRNGQRLYIVGNMSNRLLEYEFAADKVTRAFDVGVAPYDVVLVGSKAYVSNWGGRRPGAASLTGPAGHGTKVRVDPVRHIANEGSVTVIDLSTGRVVNEILVGLHSSALALTPGGRQLVVANAGSDTLCVIDTRADRLVETISLRWHPNDFFGASPNALAFDALGRNLYVCHGTQNAVGVVAFRPGKSKLLGLIPTGWFPGAIAFDARRKSLYIANIKGIGSTAHIAAGAKVKFNSHQYFGTLTLAPVPNDKQLAEHTLAVQKNYRRSVAELAKLPPRLDQPPRVVPERAGEPSLIKHVIYIIKENRTYDQVFGDIKEGNGDPELCIFGERETPNQHKLVREFVLLDNTYCSGILSADGHQWTDTAFATDYMEKSFAGFPRSYPDGMEDTDVDAIAYAPTGFIWDNALAHGKTIRDYGEFAIGITGWKDRTKKPSPKFLDFYHDFVNQTGLLKIGSRPAIASLGPHLNTETIGWDMAVPDVFRAAQFIKELRQFERDGRMPDFTIICLPNDHTSGTAVNKPTPAAQVADNDLAFGQIVEAISHSPFWKDSCILAIEDDPQAGWDHVSGYRTTAYVISPYARRRATVSVNYNQTGLLRTMELMLGLPPMNQMDATATPMTACFTDQPDFTPYTAVTNNVPLDQMNPDPKALRDPVQKTHALASARLPLEKPDQCPEDLLNRILWHAQKGSQAPYPRWAITPHGKDDDD
ncbi:MAG: bifunctional YncE family protein/alkaline phosphatase family protein [Verrucomicrobia bacterium]|nr:bifunctional YncE family protein/alkaline phosphatase family protein [Verrucomicrobiota bacterium]